jgi:hypothetical protein
MITLGPAQGRVFSSDKRFRVVIAGRRFGKTKLACVDLAATACATPGETSWYIAPTVKMAKDLVWEQLKETLAPWTLRTNEVDLTIRLFNRHTVALHSADRPDRLVGRGLVFVALDEFVQILPKLWTKVIRPALSDKVGRALFISSPEGMNWGYDLWMRGQNPDDPRWASWQFTTLQGGRVSAEEVEAAREDMDARTFRQEYEATFESAVGRVYESFVVKALPDGNICADLEDDPSAPLLVGMDFNVNPMSAVLAVKRGDELHVLDELSIQTSNTAEMASEIRRRYPARRVIVYPDPSGNARKTSAPVGQTDFTLLRAEGFQVMAPPAAPAIADRYNAVNTLSCSAAQRRRLLVHPRATTLAKALSSFRYKEGTSLPDKTGGFDHITDALGYLVWSACNPLVRSGVSSSSFSR